MAHTYQALEHESMARIFFDAPDDAAFLLTYRTIPVREERLWLSRKRKLGREPDKYFFSFDKNYWRSFPVPKSFAKFSNELKWLLRQYKVRHPIVVEDVEPPTKRLF